jgi:hypothetical protein
MHDANKELIEDTTSLPVSAVNGEHVLLHAPARYLLTTPSGAGYNPINGQLTLTNQRLVFKPNRVDGMHRIVLSAGGASVVTFPIRRVVDCSEQPLKVQWGRPNVLRLEFDTGGREYFVIHPSPSGPVGTWAAAVKQAQATASELDYDRVPALKPGFEQPASRGVQQLVLYWALSVVAICMVCALAALVAGMLGR